MPGLHDRREPAPGVQAQQLHLDRELAEPLADHRVGGHAALAGQLAQLLERDPHAGGRRGAEAGALVHERGDRDRPAVAHAADDVLVGDARLLDEELVELRLAGDLAKRAHLHGLLLHVHDEVGEALVLRRVLVGARHEHAPLGLVRVGGPDLLPGHHPLAVRLHGARLQRREVRARLGLGEALAPDLVAREDRPQPALLLGVVAVGDDHRPAHDHAEHVGRAAAPWRAPSPRRRAPAPRAWRRGRRTPSATRSPA